MNAIEKRARALLSAEYKAAHAIDPRVNFCAPEYEVAIRAIIAALTPPEGFVLVPVGLSNSMAKAAWATLADNGSFEEIWKAMLAARPEVSP